jgi:hypothetical protein
MRAGLKEDTAIISERQGYPHFPGEIGRTRQDSEPHWDLPGTTLYGDPAGRRAASFGAAALAEPVNTPARRWERQPERAAAAD